MIKKLFALILVFSVLPPPTFAFRDISPNSRLLPAIENLVNRSVLEDKGFLRPDSPVPARMFWEVTLLDAGFDPHSADFGTPLPPNIRDTDPLAPFLREAIRRDFIDEGEFFDGAGSMTRVEAIKVLVKTKGLFPPRRNSQTFLKKISGVSPLAKYLKEVEAALASRVLDEKDVDPLRPFAPLSRRDFITWLYNFDDHGVKKSTLEETKYKSRTRKSKKSKDKNDKRKKRGTQRDLKIEILTGPEMEIGSSDLDIPNSRVLQAVFDAILKKYKFSDEITEEKKKEMVDAAIGAMVKKLGDKYTSYIEPEKVGEFKDGLDGKYQGIGAYVEMFDDKMTITAPLKGSPAERAGILAGDVITAVDGESIKDNPIKESIKLIRGPEGTNVTLTISRNGSERDITVTRGRITVPALDLKWKNAVPVIEINQFERSTARDLEKMFKEQILTKHPRGIVIDLRNNPGGFLTTAVDVGEFFLKKGDLIFSVEYKDRDQKYKASKNGILSDFTGKIIILQNKASASASEIIAAMLQDYEIAQVVGLASTGKGTVQEINNYSNGSSLKLTIAKWLTPKGRWIHEKGVQPDVEVEEPTEAERKAKIDRQLDMAVRMALGKK